MCMYVFIYEYQIIFFDHFNTQYISKISQNTSLYIRHFFKIQRKKYIYIVYINSYAKYVYKARSI